jgi:hypothetical protein
MTSRPAASVPPSPFAPDIPASRAAGLSMNRALVAASRQSAATPRNHLQRRSAETPLRRGSWSQCARENERRLPMKPQPAIWPAFPHRFCTVSASLFAHFEYCVAAPLPLPPASRQPLLPALGFRASDFPADFGLRPSGTRAPGSGLWTVDCGLCAATAPRPAT